MDPRAGWNALTRDVHVSLRARTLQQRGSGKNRNRWLSTMIGSGNAIVATPQSALPRGRPLEFRCAAVRRGPDTVQRHAPGSWEFEVSLSMPGFDFEERYLVPVYEQA
jgi:hypothetical protein